MEKSRVKEKEGVYTDIIVDKGDIKNIIKDASSLGIGRLIVLHDKDYSDKEDAYHIGKDKVEIRHALLVGEKEIGKIRKNRESIIVISKIRDMRKIADSLPGGNNHRVILTDFEGYGRDSLHYRRGGLNQIIARILAKKEVVISMNLSLLSSLPADKRAYLIGRQMQNIKIARKSGLRMVFSSFASSAYDMKNPRDVASLGILMGMSPEQAAESMVIQI